MVSLCGGIGKRLGNSGRMDMVDMLPKRENRESIIVILLEKLTLVDGLEYSCLSGSCEKKVLFLYLGKNVLILDASSYVFVSFNTRFIDFIRKRFDKEIARR